MTVLHVTIKLLLCGEHLVAPLDALKGGSVSLKLMLKPFVSAFVAISTVSAFTQIKIMVRCTHSLSAVVQPSKVQQYG